MKKIWTWLATRNTDSETKELMQRLIGVDFNLNGTIGEKIKTLLFGKVDKRRLSERLEKIFGLSTFDEDESFILVNLSVLPAIYIERKLITDWLSFKKQELINSLVEKGWLLQRNSQVFCHQIIQEVVRKKFRVDITTCKNLINALADQLYFGPFDHLEQRKQYAVFGQSILNNLKEKHECLARLANNLAIIYRMLHQYTEAELLIRYSCEILETQLGGNHPDVAICVNNLAFLFKEQEKFSEAKPLFYRALEIREAQLDSDYPEVAQSLNNLAELLKDQGKYNEAEQILRRALEIYKTQFGESHPEVATRLNKLAELFKEKRNFSEAEALFYRALEIRETHLENDYPEVAESLNNLADVLMDQGKYNEAEPFLRRALEIYETLHGADRLFWVAVGLSNLGELLKNQGNFSEGVLLQKRAGETLQAYFRIDKPKMDTSLNTSVDTPRDYGKFSEATPISSREVKIRTY